MKKIYLLILLFISTVVISIGVKANTNEILLGQKYYDQNQFSKALFILNKIPLAEHTAVTSYEMGYMYEMGLGTQKDLKKAFYWYELSLQKPETLSAKANIFNALGTLAYQYHNYVKAFQYYLKAAKMGDATAECNVANYYANGIGVIEDDIKAYAWSSVAVAQGADSNGAISTTKGSYSSHSNSTDLQKSLAYKLSWGVHGELAQAQALAQQYYNTYVAYNNPPQ